MKAWLLKNFDGAKGMRLAREVVEPEPGPGEVRLRVQFAALNPADAYLARRLYPARPALPHVLGRDGAGEVDAVGAGVADWKVGDRAALLRGEAGVTRWGTFADYVIVPADVLVKISHGWKLEQAAAAPLVYLTAWQALTEWGALEPGAAALVTGATGGVGVAALHLGEAMGLKMIAVTRDMRKAEPLRANGAAMVIAPDDDNFKEKVKEFTQGKGLALVVDNVGGPGLMTLIETLGIHGRVSCVGRLAGPVPEFNTAALFFRRIKIGGIAVGAYSAPEAQAAWREIAALMEKSGRRPAIGQMIEFDEVNVALERMLQGGDKDGVGKIVVKIGD